MKVSSVLLARVTHLDLSLDVSECVGSAHVRVILDAFHIQFYLQVQLFRVCADHLLDLLGGDHNHL